MVSFDDNSTSILNPVTGNLTSTIYPPPTPTTVEIVIYSMKIKRVLVLLKTGSLCVYKIDKSTASLEKMIFHSQFKVVINLDYVRIQRENH